VGVWVAAACVITVNGTIPTGAGLALVLAVMLPYAIVLGAGRAGRARLPVLPRWESWLVVAISEEEAELREVIHPRRAHWADVLAAAAALLVVVAASLAMERTASLLGTRFAVPQIVTGGVVLAAVTSLPNAVSAVYLA